MSVPLGQHWGLLARYVWPRRRRLGLLGAVVLGNVGLRLLQPAPVRSFLDGAVGGTAAAAPTAAAGLFLLVALVLPGLSMDMAKVVECGAICAEHAAGADHQTA